MSKSVTVISLGAGVQSSALLLMSDRGDCERADFAIFADTQAEPDEVYEWLNFLEDRVDIPIFRTTKGNIVDDTTSGGRFASIPFFVRNPDGSDGLARRQCTKEYKLEPVYKFIRQQLGCGPGERMKQDVRILIGISCDEAHRMKPAWHRWATNVYPLVDQWKSRQWASDYVEKATGRRPPRSACYICPFHSNDEWRSIRDRDPRLWSNAVKFDHAMRRQDKFDGELFLHADRVPLDQVDLSKDTSQADLFGNECEGMCGI